MRAHRNAIICIAAVAALALTAADAAFAQRIFSRGPSANVGVSRGGGYYGGGNHGRRLYGGGVHGATRCRACLARRSRDDVDGGRHRRRPTDRGARRSAQRAAVRSGAPSANERRLVPDEVVIEVANSVSAQQIDALQRRYRLARIESQTFQLTGTTLYRWRIPDRRSVAAVVRALEADRVVASAQPNYLFALQQDAAEAPKATPAQYELAKLHLPQAHALAKGDNVLVAVHRFRRRRQSSRTRRRRRRNLRHAGGARWRRTSTAPPSPA